MKTADIRNSFLKFFESKGHSVQPSSSLIPENDPTLLFTNAGMNQFKDCFLGTEKRDYSRAATCQKCMRISGKHNDLENVGVTARHHTFFEMLGNFSFGDYFKEDAIRFGWEFVTEVLKVDKKRLWVTVFEEDDEAVEIWKSETDVVPERILKMGASENFWQMGDTGPCGPCTEIHYYLGDNLDAQSEEEFRKDDGTYVEFWNLVFMQFDRAADGTLTPLPKPSVDTGMGLERMTAVMNGFRANYDIDVLRAIIATCETLSGKCYDGSSYEVRDLRKDKAYAQDVAMRVIADHSRAASFLLADGVIPGSDGRGYVLRRLIRRAIRHGRVLEFGEPFLAKTCTRVIECMGDAYPELQERKETILKLVDAEERKFYETLDSGLSVLEKEISNVKKGAEFPGEVAFMLHDTYGFPLDLTQDALKAHDMTVDVAGFEQAMEAQRERSRDDRKAQDIVFTSIQIDGGETEFLGYRETEAESKVQQIFFEADQTRANTGAHVSLLFEATPFYAESGGQVGDTGIVTIGDTRLRVLDTQKERGKYYLHHCQVDAGEITDAVIGSPAHLVVDAERRNRIRANHSATHLMHSALRRVLGDHVKQAGSRVDDKTLRFDYSHFEAVTEAELRDIQEIVNSEIRSNYEVNIAEMGLEKAKKAGAMALFGEKYADIVRVVEIGPYSMELCGGTHVGRSGDIGCFFVASEGSISSGVRRIECWSGEGAYQQMITERSELAEISALLKGDQSSLPERIEKMLERTRELEKELGRAKSKLASAKSGDLISLARTSPAGIKVIAERIDGADSNTLKTMVDGLRQKLGSGVVALGSDVDGKAVIVAGVTSDLTEKLNAGSLVKEASVEAGGRGGGRPDFAQAGGVDPARLGDALDKLFQLVG